MLTSKKRQKFQGLSKLRGKQSNYFETYGRIGASWDPNKYACHNNNYRESNEKWNITVSEYKSCSVHDLNEHEIKCLKCGDVSAHLEPCVNCGGNSNLILENNGKLICKDCDRIHQQSRWICKICGCDNPMSKTISHWVEVEVYEKANNKSIISDCFIATVCYGDYNSSEVLILRNFRDTVLLNNPFGRIIIRLYYLFGPSLSRLIDKSNRVKNIIRNIILNPLIRCIKSGK